MRKLRAITITENVASPFVGIDDFAWKKGHRYGTIVVDLPTHRVIDLLPDRESATVASWMKEHPHVRVVSRDRSAAYADGVRQGAPQAMQVADRFHLHVNATEALQRVVESKHQFCVAVAKEMISPPDKTSHEQYQQTSEERVNGLVVPAKNARINHRRDRRLVCYQEVLELRNQGFGYRKIARLMGLSRATVRTWIRRGTFPEYAPMRKQGVTLFEIWSERMKVLREQGADTAIALFHALRTEGYRGSYSSMKKYCRLLWKHAAQTRKSHGAIIPNYWRSPRALTWLLLNEDTFRNDLDQRFVKTLCDRDEKLRLAAYAAREFVSLLRTKGDEKLGAWIERTKPTLLSAFACTIERDYLCVGAAMREPWSQGCVEGNVNRLKMIKRQMYGRGSFDLLRRRVLIKA